MIVNNYMIANIYLLAWLTKIKILKQKLKNKEKQCTYNVIIKNSNKPLNTEHLKLKMY